MIELKLKNETGLPYPEARDKICQALVGERAFIENDIIVSDVGQDANEITIVLGGEANKDEVTFTGSLTV